MKPPVSIKSQVLALRKSHSLREVASQMGLPLGTVKTICSRSGAFRGNQSQRALFTLPPIRASESTALTVPELPQQRVVTGDHDVDAVLWLREVIKTGQVALIQKAMEAATRVKTPLPELEKQYQRHVALMHPGNFVAALTTIGFADLEGLAVKSIKKLHLQIEATARFGDALLANTPAEQFCIDALAGLQPSGVFGDYENDQADEAFLAHPDLIPRTLSDCLHELAYWHDLYWLRNSTDRYGEPGQEGTAREWFVFRCLARIRPKSKEEAVAVLRYLVDSERMNMKETNDILLNLIV